MRPLLLALLLVVPLAAGGVGAYAGTGPSEILDDDGGCLWRGDAHVALHATADGWALHAANVMVGALDACFGAGMVGGGSWHMPGLQGSPESGFAGQGTFKFPAGGGVHWRAEVAPIAGETAWSVRFANFQPDGEVYASGTWRGWAALVGARV